MIEFLKKEMVMKKILFIFLMLFCSLSAEFSIPKLPYSYDALEPYVDTETMTLHHDKHHQAYVDNLNNALKEHPELQNQTLAYLIKNIKIVPKDIRKKVRDNAGGHYNHSLFWEIMTPEKDQSPEGALKQALIKNFGSVENFKKEFNDAAKKLFGSGWVWLCVTHGGNLKIIVTQNQDNPLTEGLLPVMGLDVWEHAYYLKYHNKRADYIDAWWYIVNWRYIEARYEKALKKVQNK